jgi:hypothetical protein
LSRPTQRTANAHAVWGFCQRSYSTLQVVAEKATIAISCCQRSKAPNCPKLCYIISHYSSVWLNPSPTETINSLCKIAPPQRATPEEANATADALGKFSLLMALHKRNRKQLFVQSPQNYAHFFRRKPKRFTFKNSFSVRVFF